MTLSAGCNTTALRCQDDGCLCAPGGCEVVIGEGEVVAAAWAQFIDQELVAGVPIYVNQGR